MEYVQTATSQIQADFARRAGQLLLQYERMCGGLPSEQRFEATLSVALLHPMLTYAMELLPSGRAKRSQSADDSELERIAKKKLRDEPALLGLDAGCVLECWPCAEGPTYATLLEGIRHALSHPCSQDRAEFPVTGYSTVPSGSGHIEVYEFVQSPWVDGAQKTLSRRFAPMGPSPKDGERLEHSVRAWSKSHGVQGLEVRRDADGRWKVFLGEDLFVPVLCVRLTTTQLRTFALTLSDLLAEAQYDVKNTETWT